MGASTLRNMRVASFVVLFTTFVALVGKQLGFVDIMLLVISTMMTCYIFQKYPFWGNWAKYLVLFAVWVSVVAFPSFNLVTSKAIGGRAVEQVDLERLISFGCILFFITVSSWLIFERYGSRKPYKVVYQPKPIPKKHITVLLVFLYVLTAFCYVTGLGRMGAEAVVLPFHLGGMINLFRSALVPSIFVLIVENYILHQQRIPRSFIFFAIGWCLFESLAWLSKATLINYLFKAALVAYIYYRPPFKVVLKKSLVIVALFIMAYPIIGFMRSTDIGSGGLINSAKEAKEMSDEENSLSNGILTPILTPMNRVFMTGGQYIKDYDYLKDDAFFEFSRLPLVVASGGAAAYQTLVVDGYSADAHHSSGTTGIMDPLLHGGRGLCYIIIVLIMLFAVGTDRMFRKQKHGIYVQLLGLILGWVLFNNISSLYDSVGLQTYAMAFLGLYLTNRFNYKKVI